MKTIKEKILHVILLVYVCGTFGCSTLLKIDYLKANTEGTDWARSTWSSIASYKFQGEGVTLYTCPALRGRWKVISTGPPIIPLIPAVPEPNFPYSGEAKFEFTFRIESSSAETSIDFAKIALILPDGRTLMPAKVLTRRPCRTYPNDCNCYPDDIKAIPIDQFVVVNDIRYFELEFAMSRVSVEECVIELGTIIVNGKKVEVPPLRFKKDDHYRYRPFFFPFPV